MSAFLTGVLVLIWIACVLGAIHSAKNPHPRLLRYSFDVAVRAGVDILCATGFAVWAWHTFIR